MFDTLIVRPTEHKYVTVVENRAPTDECIRLLREMEEKAEAKVLATIRLDSNEFNGVVHILQRFDSALIIAKAIFDLNGTRLVAEVSAPDHSLGKRELLQKLHARMAEAIAAHILSSIKLPSF